MQAWGSLSRCFSHPGCIAAHACRSSPSLYARCHSIRRMSSSTKEGSKDAPCKPVSLSETLRLMDNIPHPKISTKEPQSPEYTSLLKFRQPALGKKTKLKRRPRDTEKMKRIKERRETKQLLKKIQHLNKQIESGLPGIVDSEGGRPINVDWKGISQKPLL